MVEALIGAIFIDGGLEWEQNLPTDVNGHLLHRWLFSKFDIEAGKDPKGLLQTLTTKNYSTMPVYKVSMEQH